MTEKSPAETVMLLSTAYWASRCMHVAAEFGIADALGDEPQTAAALASKTSTHAAALHRILRSLATHGVFVLKDGKFSHNEASRLLRSDNPRSMRSLSRMMGLDFHWDTYRELTHSLKSGKPAVGNVVKGGLFDYMRDHPEQGRIFNEAMIGKSFGQIGPVLEAYDFSGFRTIGDIGGGMGHLLGAVLDATPGADGILVDLPEVIAHAKGSPHPRMSYVGADFFKDTIPTCDAYIMMMVLHDWSDEESIAILKNIKAGARAGAKLILVEAIIDESAIGSLAIDIDIEMLAMTTGKERTKAEWEKLLSAAGYKLTRAFPVGGYSGIVEAVID
ncbi:MAG: methyltransferase [Pseudomonadota bacterium]